MVSADASMPAMAGSGLRIRSRLWDEAAHTRLDDIDAYILDASLNLLLHKRRRNVVNVSHAMRILRRESRRRRHGVATVCARNLLIRLQAAGVLLGHEVVGRWLGGGGGNSRPARAVGAGNDQYSSQIGRAHV